MVHEFFCEARHRVAFALSTKDRVALTREMLPPFLEEGAYDLFLLDGSATEEGQRFPFELQAKSQRVREIHTGVYGGPDVAIVRALSRMLEAGYEYCGLIENDVKLKSGWFANLTALLDRGQVEGLRVGAVGSRTYRSRVLISRDDFAIMLNLGAGMILLHRDAARIILNGYRTANWYEVYFAALHGAGVSLNDQCGRRTSLDLMNMVRTADWWFDALLLLNGYCSLAPAPTMAENIDPQARSMFGGDYVQSRFKITDQDDQRFCQFVQKQDALAASDSKGDWLARSKLFLTHSQIGRWFVFPHQALTLGGCELTGPWAMKWLQTWGPFSFCAQSGESKLKLKCAGDSCAIGVIFGPNAGVVEARANDTVIAQADLRRETEEIALVQLQMPYFDEWQIDVRPTSQGIFQWTGVSYRDAQPWFSAKTGFDFSVLKKYV